LLSIGRRGGRDAAGRFHRDGQLSKPYLAADLGTTQSILQPFVVEPQRRASGLADWDLAFLRGLYGPGYTPKQHRSSIATRMVGDLAPPWSTRFKRERVRV
jgi:hypothetical protein